MSKTSKKTAGLAFFIFIFLLVILVIKSNTKNNEVLITSQLSTESSGLRQDLTENKNEGKESAGIVEFRNVRANIKFE